MSWRYVLIKPCVIVLDHNYVQVSINTEQVGRLYDTDVYITTKSSYLVSCQKLNLLDKYNILPQNVVHEMLLQWLCGYIKLPTEDRAYHPPMLVAKFMKC